LEFFKLPAVTATAVEKATPHRQFSRQFVFLLLQKRRLLFMSEKKKSQNEEPTIATGIDDDEELSAEATPEEIKRGEYTKVITLSYDDERTEE
jgi:hypothetical protein